MEQYIRNPDRLQELEREERYQVMAKKIAAFNRKDVLHVICWTWGLTLGIVFTVIVAIRLGMTIPLF